MADLVTAADVKTSLGISGTVEDARLTLLCSQVSDEIERFCNRDFHSATVTEYYDGQDAFGINLKRPPITSMTTVHVSTSWPRAYGSTELLVSGTDYTWDATNGILYRNTVTWPVGQASVKVVYVGGYSTIPGDVQRSAIEIIATKLEKGRSRLYHIFNENRGDGSISGIMVDDWPVSAVRTLGRYKLTR
jgi:hypothetical protein